MGSAADLGAQVEVFNTEIERFNRENAMLRYYLEKHGYAASPAPPRTTGTLIFCSSGGRLTSQPQILRW